MIIAVDNGTDTIKAGLGGSPIPTVVVDTMHQTARTGSVRPIENGRVINWDVMQALWERVFTGLGVNVPEHPVVITEPPLHPAANREKMTQLMFEAFNVPVMQSVYQGVAAALSCGLSTCSVGYYLPHSVGTWQFGGRNLTRYMVRLLSERGYNFSVDSVENFSAARGLKERMGFISLDFDSDSANSHSLESSFALPDGNSLTVSNERFRCPEALFSPSMIGCEHFGIHEILFNTIMKGDSDIRHELLGNVVLNGGSCSFPGFSKRMEKELTQLLSPAQQRMLKVTAPTAPRFSDWAGACVKGTTSNLQWISRQAYDEHGPAIIHRLSL
ncbi:actin [Pelomyxa schiedti]|nr:actin [Pelomyxa schiedti]